MTDPIKHTPACDAAQAEARAYIAAHPHYCSGCGGAGSWYFAGSRDEPSDSGPCPECVEKGFCPLCAQALVFEEHEHCDYGRCVACGWDEWKIHKNEQPLQIYPDRDCYCYEESP